MSGCRTAQLSPVTRLEKIDTRLSTDSLGTYSEKDWKELVDELTDINDYIGSHRKELSDDELARTGYLNGKIAGTIARHALKSGKSLMRMAGKQIGSMLEGFKDALGIEEDDSFGIDVDNNFY